MIRWILSRAWSRAGGDDLRLLREHATEPARAFASMTPWRRAFVAWSWSFRSALEVRRKYRAYDVLRRPPSAAGGLGDALHRAEVAVVAVVATVGLAGFAPARVACGRRRRRRVAAARRATAAAATTAAGPAAAAAGPAAARRGARSATGRRGRRRRRSRARPRRLRPARPVGRSAGVRARRRRIRRGQRLRGRRRIRRVHRRVGPRAGHRVGRADRACRRRAHERERDREEHVRCREATSANGRRVLHGAPVNISTRQIAPAAEVFVDTASPSRDRSETWERPKVLLSLQTSPRPITFAVSEHPFPGA